MSRPGDASIKALATFAELLLAATLASPTVVAQRRSHDAAQHLQLRGPTLTRVG